MNSIQGTAYLKTAGKILEANIEVLPHCVCAHLSTGDMVEIPHVECRIEQGGMSGKMLMCHSHDGEYSICSEQKEFRDQLQHVGLHTEALANVGKQVSRSRWKNRSLAFSVLAVFVLLVAGGYFAVVGGARAAVRAAPVSLDREIGDALKEGMNHGGPELTQPDVKNAVAKIVERLSPHAETADFEFQVVVIDAPVLNAYAMPGGHIVVYAELIRQSDSPEQVAGVIAHEMAHVTRRHSIQAIAESIGLLAAFHFVFGDVSGLTGMGVETLERVALSSYSRSHEAEADEVGVKMLHDARIDPQGLIEFFNHLKESEQGHVGAPAWISTHPEHDARIEAIGRQIRGFGEQEYEPFEFDWELVQSKL